MGPMDCFVYGHWAYYLCIGSIWSSVGLGEMKPIRAVGLTLDGRSAWSGQYPFVRVGK